MLTAQEIVEQGRYGIVEYSERREVAEVLRKGFQEAVFRVTEKRVEDLSRLHEEIHADQVIPIQDSASRLLKRPMLEWTMRLAGVLGLTECYLDLMTIARIKPPFDEALRSTVSYREYSLRKGRTVFQRDPAETASYHRYLPFAAWNHGPHEDSWFGHSWNGINLWWAVEGCLAENGMVLYPEVIGQELPTYEEPPYVRSGVPLPRPEFFNLEPGAVIAFNADTLHSSRVNLTETTRVSFSTRINPSRPVFDPKPFRHVKYWIHSKDWEYWDGELPSNEDCHELTSRPSPGVETIGKEAGERRCQTAFQGERLKNLPFRHYQCPHLGYDLRCGAIRNGEVICPGHGIAFNIKTGKSLHPRFQVEVNA